MSLNKTRDIYFIMGVNMNEKKERLKAALGNGLLLFTTQGLLLLYFWHWSGLDKGFLIGLTLAPVITSMIVVYIRTRYKTFKISKDSNDGLMLKKLLTSKKSSSVDVDTFKLKNKFTVTAIKFSVEECDAYYQLRAPKVFVKILKHYGIRNASCM